MSRALQVCLLLLTAAPARAGVTAVPTEYEEINRPPPELVVVNPFFMLEGEKIRGVRFEIDGSWYEHKCGDEDRGSDGKRCGDPTRIDPGMHIFTAAVCTRADCVAFGKAWRTEMRFSVGLRERVKIDLGKLVAAKEGHEADAITREPLAGKPQSACAEAIERAIYVDTCTAPGIEELKGKLDALQRTCAGGGWTRDTDRSFELVVWQAATQRPQHCYKASELKKLPPFLVEWTMEESFWPPGTIKNGASSWRWARDMEDGSLFERLSGEALRKEAFKMIDRWRERQHVVDKLILAALDPQKHLGPLVDEAAQAKWDLNPMTPAGHRAFALSKLAGFDPRFRDHPKLSALLAKGGAGDDKVHCAYHPEVEGLMRSYLSDDAVSADEWKAIVGFLRRTPADASLRGCQSAFGDKVNGPIAQADRLVALGEADCAAARDVKVRGETLSSFLDPEHNSAPKPLRLWLMKKFADCVHF